MMFGVVVAVACVSQVHSEIDGPQRRRIFDAAKAADLWVWEKSRELYPGLTIVQAPPRRRAFLEAEQARCRRDLVRAADLALCKEFKIPAKTYYAILSRPDIARQSPHEDGPGVPPSNTYDVAPEWMRMKTRFDPKMVHLPPKLAKRYGYVNPVNEDRAAKAKEPTIMDQLLGR
jgi:hypothetical protein